MPRAVDSHHVDMSNHRPTPIAASSGTAHASPVSRQPTFAPPTVMPSRSPVMIASMPGMNSGPDAVLRQFNGGRVAPQQRIFVL